MPVASPFILYIGASAYDLRKVSSAVVHPSDPTITLVRFIDEPRTVFQVATAVFEPAWQIALDAVQGGGGGTYTNPNPVPFTVGGIQAGTTFPTPYTMKQMWDMLLYPNTSPQFTSFAIQGEPTVLEVGATIPASVTFTWTTSNPSLIQPSSISIIDVTGGNLTLAAGLANDGVEPLVMTGPIQLLAAGSYQFKIQGVNTSFNPFSKFLTFYWEWKLFYGNNANPTLTEPDILAMSGALSGTYAGSYPMAAGGYKFISQSDDLGGQINRVYDPATSFDIPMADVSDDPSYSNVDGGGFSYALVPVTNAEGVISNYRVYRTRNSLGSSLTLAVT
jgi:hypothetical protein